ncbi:MAG: winged helix-turn-helix domain-containing protein [Methanotrichaceae archaeon]
MMRRKRSSDMIIAQILEVCIDGATKTRIVYQSNLNFRTVNPYIDLLVRRRLIETAQDNRKLYKTTEEGIELMKCFKHHYEEISKLHIAIDNTV